MNKSLNKNIKDTLFKYISLIFNVAESSEIMFGVQLYNAEDYYYEIVSELERIATYKHMKFYTIDLAFEDFGMSEIDQNGKRILPPWLKNNKHAVILVYNIDELKKRSYKLRQLREIFINGTIEGVKIPPTKHFILISNKDLKLKPNIIELDIKKAANIIENENRKANNE